MTEQPGCPGFTTREHTADELIEARGRSLEEAFEQAALGVFEVITDTSRVECRVEKEVNVDGVDLENLLYRWIEELLYYLDAEGLVFSVFKVKSIRETSDGYLLEASVCGEKFDPGKHEHRTIVKAMTYAQMSIEKKGDCWVLTFVVDI
ncbi:MAG: archease [Desulfurococcales archaeon]|nr:archease [Desulfurococcales archaeon]